MYTGINWHATGHAYVEAENKIPGLTNHVFMKHDTLTHDTLTGLSG